MYEYNYELYCNLVVEDFVIGFLDFVVVVEYLLIVGVGMDYVFIIVYIEWD